jgi:hypothetical protein
MKIYRAVPDQPGFFGRGSAARAINRKPAQHLSDEHPVQAGVFSVWIPRMGPPDAINMGFTSPNTFVVERSALGMANPACSILLAQVAWIVGVFQPSNTVTLGSTTLSKKKERRRSTSLCPTRDLTASGSGVSAASAGHAQISKAVTPGPTQLLIKATGKKSKTLNQKGKVTLTVAITYTPTNGAPGTQSVQVQLKKKLKKK